MFNDNIVNENINIHSEKLSKSRVIIVVITLTLIIALISGLMIIKSSLDYSMEKSQAKKYGNFFGYISSLDSEEVDELKKDKKLTNVYTSQSLGYAINYNSINDYTKYLHIVGIDDTYIENMPINMVKGRIPQNSEEIILPDYVIYSENSIYKLGDKLNLNIGQRVIGGKVVGQTTPCETDEELTYEKSMQFTIVGFYEGYNYEDEFIPGFSAMTIASKSSEYKGLYDVYFRTLRAKDFKSYRNNLKYDNYFVNTNSSVLMVSGQSYITQSSYTTALIVIILICLALIVSKQFQYLENKKIYKCITGVKVKTLFLITSIVLILGFLLGLLGAFIIIKAMKDITINCFSVFEFELTFHLYLNSFARIIIISAIIVLSGWVVNILINCINKLIHKSISNGILTSIFVGVALIGSFITYGNHIVEFLGLRPDEVDTYVLIDILAISWITILSLISLINVVVSMYLNIEAKVKYYKEYEYAGNINKKDIPKLVSKICLKYIITGAIYSVIMPIIVDNIFYYLFSYYLSQHYTLPYIYIGVSVLCTCIIILVYRIILLHKLKNN